MWINRLSLKAGGRLHPERFASLQQRWQTSQILLQNISLKHDVMISTITLNRPKANAMGSQMIDELSRVIDILEQESTRCVILTSSSLKVFSAGADLKERAAMNEEEAEVFVHRLRTTVDRFSKLPMPTICSVEGVAVGGGLELAMAADVRIAGRNAVFGLPETSLAIIPGAGGTQRLPRLIGEARAKELIFTGRRIDAETAYEYGLVQHAVDCGHADEKAMEMADVISRNGPVAIRAAKTAIQRGLEETNMLTALAIERSCYALVIPTKDRLEGLAAFREGRSPVYTGDGRQPPHIP